jgi:hypothetical protein
MVPVISFGCLLNYYQKGVQIFVLFSDLTLKNIECRHNNNKNCPIMEGGEQQDKEREELEVLRAREHSSNVVG